MIAWSGAGLSAAANFIVLGYVAIYCTDTLGLSPAIVGVLLLVSSMCNAVFGLIAAYIVDRSPETRLGKARPYEFAVIGVWLITWLLFSTPAQLDEIGRASWVFVTFISVNAIFDTLLRANDALYMARAFNGRRVFAKVATRAGVITSLGAVAVTVLLPLALDAAGKSPEGWSVAVLAFAAPLTVIGMLRFLFVKEVHATADTGATPVRIRDIVMAMRFNKWVFALAAVQLIAAAVVGTNAGAYYFRYVVGNLGLQGIVLGFGVVVLPIILVFPTIMRRFAISQIIVTGAVCGFIGSLINAFADGSIPVLVVGALLTGVALLPVSFLIGVMILDLASFNEWKGHRRLESSLSAVVGVFGKVGAGLAGALVGWSLSVAGYDGSAETQSPAAEGMIVGLYSWFPAALFALLIVVMGFYMRFDRRLLPAIHAELDERGPTSRLESVGEVTLVSTPPALAGGPTPVDPTPRIELEQLENPDPRP